MRAHPTLFAGLLSLSLATAASAATTIRITGSTAFRTATVTAIENLYGSGNFEAIYRNTDSGVTNEKNAKIAIFKGNITGANNPVTIKCAWAGSTGGIKTVAKGDTLTNSWIADAELSGTNGITNKASFTYDAATTADVTMSDTRQAATKYTSTPSLTATKVGVVPFVWIKNNGAPSGLNNMTALLARAVLVGGTPLAHFTGSSADTTYVYAVGRDQDSGTRVAAFADSGFGSQSSPLQFQINASGGTVASAESYPATTLLGETFPLGTAGYSGGGGLVAVMNLTGSSSATVYDTTNGAIGSGADILANGAYFVGYVGTSDAKSLTGHSQDSGTGIFSSTGELQVLTYNGVQYSFANVREGKYSFWTYEWLMYRTSLSTDGKTVANKLATEISTNTASVSGILLSTMNCSRSVEGGIISHN